MPLPFGLLPGTLSARMEQGAAQVRESLAAHSKLSETPFSLKLSYNFLIPNLTHFTEPH